MKNVEGPETKTVAVDVVVVRLDVFKWTELFLLVMMEGGYADFDASIDSQGMYLSSTSGSVVYGIWHRRA